MSHHHRPTLKQQNKPFKSRHATKSATKNLTKGRVARRSQKSSLSNTVATQSRINRRNTAKQTQLRKRQALLASTRIFNGVNGAPRIVAVVPLCPDVFAQDVVRVLSFSFNADVNVEDCPETGLWHLKAERFKTSLQFTLLQYRNLFATLDACKVADYIVFVLSATQEVDEWGDLLLRCLQAQGLPEVVTLVGPPRSEQSTQPKVSRDLKMRSATLKSLLSFIRYFVPSQARVYDLEDASASDGVNVIRALCEGKPSDVQWRQGRTWLLGEAVEWEDQATGLLKVTGIIRGSPLSVNRLVHIPNYGDFQQLKIVSAPQPASRKGAVVSMDVEPATLAVSTSDADSLISLNDPDTMANEQTWPTDEEMREDVRPLSQGDETELPDAHLGTTPKRVQRVPKGTSQYQAAWIVEDEDDEDDGSVDSVEDGNQDEEMQDLDMDTPPIPQDGGMEESDRKSIVAFKDLDEEEERKQLATWRTREHEVENEMAFPDEVDTPQDVPARERFQRYRGLHSFRASPWDPYENLPRDYGKIFQFEDFRRTERAIRRRAEDESENNVLPGMRVTVYVKNVPQTILQECDSAVPFVMFGLLQHEHKVSVFNLTVQRNTEFSEPVKSKDPMILCAGPRRFRINPVFSQHTRGGGKGINNVHKFERFFLPGVTCVATIYAPVIFGKPPCMLLKETADPNAPQLVGMGTFLNADTTRIIAKRIVLSGHPFKVHKKTATVRYMLFNPEDVAYFAPIQLHTKRGRSGHIRESLGTHGYFKAHFDGPVNQMDTVCMSLYKRIFPKWSSLHNQLPSVVHPEATMEE